MVSSAVVVAAWASERAGTTPVRHRGRADAALGACLVLALYALTAALRHQPVTVSVLLVSALAVAVWAWWDPSRGTLAVACAAAVAGPLAEIGIVAVGAARYEHGVDQLAGVAPWLPGLYFAAGAVASRLWAAVQRDGDQPIREPTTAS